MQATDRIVGGELVDVTHHVAIGGPQWVAQRGDAMIWKVPYDVRDAAGNAATTVFREVGRDGDGGGDGGDYIGEDDSDDAARDFTTLSISLSISRSIND